MRRRSQSIIRMWGVPVNLGADRIHMAFLERVAYGWRLSIAYWRCDGRSVEHIPSSAYISGCNTLVVGRQ